MRIIDKNHDFYDYLQSPTDNRLVFDRRRSFQLTKERIWCAIRSKCGLYRWNKTDEHTYLLLQCGAHFWLFVIITPCNYSDIKFPSRFDRFANSLVGLNL